MSKIDTVKACVPCVDGGYLIVLRGGGSARSNVELPEGARVVVRNGYAERSR